MTILAYIASDVLCRVVYAYVVVNQLLKVDLLILYGGPSLNWAYKCIKVSDHIGKKRLITFG